MPSVIGFGTPHFWMFGVLFGHEWFVVVEFSPKIMIWFHVLFSLSASEQLFHHINFA
jgi:hypothetical protein